MESVTKTIPKAIKNIPEIIFIMFRCLFIFLKKLEKKLKKILARIKGNPSPREKIPRSDIPSINVSILLARSNIPDKIKPTHGIQPKEKVTPIKNDLK